MLIAPADWKLAALVGTDESYRDAAVRLLRAVGSDLADCGSGIRTGDPDAVAHLSRALALRGVVSGVAGTTAVLSGAEHVISHMLDQYHGHKHLPMGQHGSQVGAASVFSACAWEMAFERLTNRPWHLDEAWFDADRARSRVTAAFAVVDETGQVGAECWFDYEQKHRVVTKNRDRLETLLHAWPRHAAVLESLTTGSAEIAAGLQAAGSPALFSQLEPRVDDDLAWWAVSHCGLMRNRFNVVDLLDVLGWWTPDDVSEVFARTHQAVPTTS